MIWAIDYRDTSGVAMRRIIKGEHTWLLIAKIAQIMESKGCVVNRIEIVKFPTHAKEA